MLDAAKALAAAMPYPRSFLGLLLTGFTLVMLPLVGAMAYSAWNTEKLAQQLTVLNDPRLATDYGRVHRSFLQLAEEIAQLPIDDAQTAALKRTVEQEKALYELLTSEPRPRL